MSNPTCEMVECFHCRKPIPEADAEPVEHGCDGPILVCEGCFDRDNVDFDEEWHHEHGYDMIDGVGFADPGGESALRASSRTNPRNLPCPNCGRDNMLTPIDKQRGYQCDICANETEMGY